MVQTFNGGRAASGLACRTAITAAVVLSNWSNVQIEFNTLKSQQTPAVAFCFYNISLSPNGYQLTSIRQGGSQFDLTDVELLNNGSRLESNLFFASSAAASVSAIAIHRPWSLLSRDRYFHQSFTRYRFALCSVFPSPSFTISSSCITDMMILSF
jgi:hypothetical protein